MGCVELRAWTQPSVSAAIVPPRSASNLTLPGVTCPTQAPTAAAAGLEDLEDSPEQQQQQQQAVAEGSEGSAAKRQRRSASPPDSTGELQLRGPSMPLLFYPLTSLSLPADCPCWQSAHAARLTLTCQAGAVLLLALHLLRHALRCARGYVCAGKGGAKRAKKAGSPSKSGASAMEEEGEEEAAGVAAAVAKAVGEEEVGG